VTDAATRLTALAERIELWPVDRLRPYERNPRTHGDDQVAQLAASMVEFGFTNPILVGEANGILAGEANGILAGHGRLMAARQLGLAEVPVVRLEHLSEAQKRAYVIADNQLAATAGWNDERLAEEIGWLRDERFDLDLLGFDATELERLLSLDGTDPGGGRARGRGARAAQGRGRPTRRSLVAGRAPPAVRRRHGALGRRARPRRHAGRHGLD
jgi:ParB-like chromosome segregation protein Spo0J